MKLLATLLLLTACSGIPVFEPPEVTHAAATVQIDNGKVFAETEVEILIRADGLIIQTGFGVIVDEARGVIVVEIRLPGLEPVSVEVPLEALPSVSE